jgi:uncharacterized protein YjiS (DUF1127 family)
MSSTIRISRPVAAPSQTSPRTFLYAIIAALLAASERRRQREALEALDERLLRDIGLTRAEARREFERRG